MMPAASKIREEVMAEIIKVVKEAMDRGQDGLKAAEAAFPGIPIEVATDAWLQVCSQEVEAWWQTVERTIDGELIKNALGPKV